MNLRCRFVRLFFITFEVKKDWDQQKNRNESSVNSSEKNCLPSVELHRTMTKSDTKRKDIISFMAERGRTNDI